MFLLNFIFPDASGQRTARTPHTFRLPARRMLKQQFFLGTACCAVVLLVSGCLPSGKARTPRLSDDALMFSQARQALEVRDYHDAAAILQVFLREFPKSTGYCWGLQRMGEAMEGLLDRHYLLLIEQGTHEAAGREAFLSSYGAYACWETDGARLRYDGSHYRRVLDEYPDSNIADEAAYRLVLLDADPERRPESLRQEVQALERVLELYPTTSLRCEILYNMAYRCHRLYELHAYAGRPGGSDRGEAQRYREKALYLYTLVLRGQRHSLHAERAWEKLRALEANRRIFR